MSLDTFKQRMADNVPGKIYVGDQCLDCDWEIDRELVKDLVRARLAEVDQNIGE